MQVYYNMQISSKNKMIDGLPMQLAVGSKLDCKVKEVEPIKVSATQDEIDWYNKEVKRKIDG